MDGSVTCQFSGTGLTFRMTADAIGVPVESTDPAWDPCTVPSELAERGVPLYLWSEIYEKASVFKTRIKPLQTKVQKRNLRNAALLIGWILCGIVAYMAGVSENSSSFLIFTVFIPYGIQVWIAILAFWDYKDRQVTDAVRRECQAFSVATNEQMQRQFGIHKFLVLQSTEGGEIPRWNNWPLFDPLLVIHVSPPPESPKDGGEMSPLMIV